MALNDGFQRIECPAYFGYSIDGDGYDAIVVIGENLIEIRDLNDNPLSQWIPGAYSCNEQDIPLRAYFNGDEWLAPQEPELQEILDQYIYPQEAVPSESTRTKSRKRSWIWLLIILIALFIGAFFALRPLTAQLMSPAIRSALDQEVLAYLEDDYENCNMALTIYTHDKLMREIESEGFVVKSNVDINYARLPSGRLLVSADFMGALDNVEEFASLLQLANRKNTLDDAATEIIANMGLWARIRFLANTKTEESDLIPAWEKFSVTDQFDRTLYQSLTIPRGDFERLSESLGWPEQNYPSEPTHIVLTDEEWLSLSSFCKLEN